MSKINKPLFGVKATSKSNVGATTCANSRNVLTKASDDVTIKSYFEGVRQLRSQYGEDAFCVNLDEVWPLVYDTKGNCVSDLKAHFFQDVDYEVFIQKDKNPIGGRPSVSYYLTRSR